MTRRLRIVLVIGLVLLGFVGFYPPVKRPPHLTGTTHRDATREWPLGQRSLLLGNDYMYLYRDPKNQLTGDDTEIDIGRLLGESILILALTGIGVVLLLPNRKPARNGA